MALKQCLTPYLIQYFMTFLSLLLISNISYYFDTIVSLLGQLLVLSVISWHLIKIIRKYVYKELVSSNKRAVLITGCDTGFGNATALKLNENGFRVYATVLDPECKGAKDLMTGSSFPDMIHVMRMNVTNDREVSAVYQQIKQQLQENREELWAVVNNAGIYTNAPIDWGTVDNYKEILEVNTFGTVRVTRAFLPLIRQSKGHIVNVVSISGRVALPFVSAYAMSKYATLSFSDALRRENQKWGISVSTIEPFPYKTPIASPENFQRYIDKQWVHTSIEVKQEYGNDYPEQLAACMIKLAEGSPSDLSKVIDAIVDAVQNSNPDIHYCVAPNIFQSTCFKLLLLLPTEFVDYFSTLVFKGLL